MSVDLQCPSRAELEDLAVGRTLPRNSSRLQQHLDKCSRCRGIWQMLAGRPWTRVAEEVCPPRDEIEALLSGHTLTDGADLHQHLENCLECRNIWQSIGGAPSTATVPAVP